MPKSAEPGSLSFLVRHTWLCMRSAVEVELRAYGLSVPQYAALKIAQDRQGCSVADFGRAMGSTRQAANELLAGLERDGLVERTPNPDDRRIQRIALTGRGLRRLEEARPAVARREAELEAGFTEEQRDAVRAWLSSVSEAALKPTGR